MHDETAKSPLPVDLDAICDVFEDNWREGRPTPLEDHLADCPAAQRQSLFLELLKVELEYRRRRGEWPTAKEYASRFPDDEDTIRSALSSVRRFFCERRHAVGGMSEIFEARDDEITRRVALKKLKASLSDVPRCRELFVQEAKIIGRLEHPNIVPIYGLGTDNDGHLYYAMKFIRGASLQRHIDEHHSPGQAEPGTEVAAMSLRQLLGRFNEVCRAIQFAHDHGVIHRDLKPHNIMLGDYGESLVVDWGISKAVPTTEEGASDSPADETTLPQIVPRNETHPGARQGTAEYMSPEQAAGEVGRVGPHSDVYSLGATLYCLLTGQAPVSGDSREEKLRRVTSGDFPAPRAVKRSIPPGLEAVCQKAMMLDPIDRYESVRTLSSDIERWLDDDPLSVYPDPLPVRLRKLARRHQAMVASAVAAVVVAFVAMMIVFAIQRGYASTLAASNTEIKGLNEQLVVEKSETEDQRDAARRNLALNYWNQADVKRIHEVTMAGHLFAHAAEGFRGTARAGEAVFAANKLTRRVQLATIIEHPQSVIGAAMFDNEQRLLSISRDGTALVSDVRTGEELRILKFSGFVIDFRFVGESRKRILVWTGQGVELWDPGSGTRLVRVPSQTPVVGAIVSASGDKILSWSQDGTVRLNALDGGESLQIVKHGPIEQGSGGASLNHDETKMLSWQRNSGVRLTNIETGDQLVLHHPGQINGAIFGKDQTQILTWGDDRHLRMWIAGDGTELRSLKLAAPVQQAVFSDDGKTVIATAHFRAYRVNARPVGYTCVWNLDSGESWVKEDGFGLYDVDRTGLLNWDFHGGVKYRRVSTGEVIAATKHDRPVLGAMYSDHGRRIISWSEDGVVRVWDASNGDLYQSLTHPGLKATSYHQDGNAILTWSRHGSVRLWNAATGELIGEMHHETEVSGASFVADGKRVLTWSVDGTTKLWDIHAPSKVVQVRHEGLVGTVLFDKGGGNVLSCARPRGPLQRTQPKYWQRETGDPYQQLKARHSIENAFFSNEKRLIAGWGRNLLGSPGLTVWSADSGEVVARVPDFQFFGGPVFSRDDTKFVTWMADGEVRVWSTKEGSLLKKRKFASQPSAAAFSSDGRDIAVAGGTPPYGPGFVQVWRWETDTIGQFEHEGHAVRVMFADKDTRILVQENVAWGVQYVTLWSASDGKQLARWRHVNLQGLLFSKDENVALTVDAWGGWAATWNLETGEMLGAYHHPRLTGASWNHDESQVFTYGYGGVRFWTKVGVGIRSIKFDGLLYRVWLLQDGARLVGFGTKGPDARGGSAFQVWETQSGYVLYRFSSANDIRLYPAVSPDGKHVAIALADRNGRDVVEVHPIGLHSDESPESCQLRLQVRTGCELDADLGILRPLSREDWMAKRKKYRALTNDGSP